jgi:NAD(P)-dependent dehydrogenase (short-subunit alcohol dehydrogenase family)
MMGVLDRKVAVITGSSRGLGLAMARAYVREGAAVMLSSRSQADIDRVVAELRGLGAQAAGMVCDVADLHQVRALADAAEEAFGSLDIWVNNAGMAGPYGPTASVPVDRFEKVLNTNIFGAYHGSIVAIQHFAPRRTGKLINILGRGDDQPVPFQNAYASTKTWMRAFTVAMAREYRDTGIEIYAFNPGLMTTEFMSRVEAVQGYAGRMKPLEMVMRLWSNPPETPAEKAVWLASASTDGKTGLVVRVITPAFMLGGILREGMRRLTRRPGPDYHLEVAEIPPAIPFPLAREKE